MTDPRKTVVLIDGSSYLYRAFHALPALSNAKGQPTGATYGVISMINKLIADYNPAYIAVVFDPKGKTQRDEIYQDYKAHRPPMPSELSQQISDIHSIINALGIPIIIEPGIEADDVIGTLASQATQEGFFTVISTGDKDMAQLVSPSVTLINTMTNTVFDEQGVIQKFGIPPSLIVDYLALIGDKVDNIPGVPNVGPKTAVKWLTTYGSLDGVVTHANEIKGKVGEQLRDHLQTLPLAMQLVTIYADLSLPYQVSKLVRQPPDKKLLIQLYKELEFKQWLATLLAEVPSQETKAYPILAEKLAIERWLAKIAKSDCYALELQGSHADPMRAELIGIGLAVDVAKAGYIPLGHQYPGVSAQVATEWLLEKMKPILGDKKTLVAENIKSLLTFFRRCNIEVNNILYDTQLESYIQNSATARHDKYTLALKYLGRRMTTYEEIAGKGAKQQPCQQLSIDQLGQHVAEGADIVLQLHQAMWPAISKDQALLSILTEMEMPLTRILAGMEHRGVLIDAAMLTTQSHVLAKRIHALELEAYDVAGSQFNLGSPKQLQTILYEKLQLPIKNKTPTGQPSTSEAVLHELAEDYPLPKLILEHRSLSKLKTTYTDRLPENMNPKTGRVHTCYNQAVTSTGRLSSTDPNLQNIPIRTEEGRRIRQAFIAQPGFKIISADYSQIELRIMAHLCKDPGLLRAFAREEDIHQATAAEVFNVAIDKVTTLQRRSAKVINFGLMYGMSTFGLSRQLGVDRALAQQYMDRYFERYPAIRAYMETTRQLAHQQGYVETLHKRRIYLPEINATNLPRQKAAERAAINAPLQGTAAEIIKLAMIKIDDVFKRSQTKARMIMQVHDELVFEAPAAEVKTLVTQIQDAMTQCVELDIPLVVHINTGDNWDEAH